MCAVTPRTGAGCGGPWSATSPPRRWRPAWPGRCASGSARTWWPTPAPSSVSYTALGTGVALAWPVIMAVCGGYDLRTLLVGVEELRRVVRAGISLLALLGFVFFVTNIDLSRGYVASMVPFVVLFTGIWRLTLRYAHRSGPGGRQRAPQRGGGRAGRRPAAALRPAAGAAELADRPRGHRGRRPRARHRAHRPAVARPPVAEPRGDQRPLRRGRRHRPARARGPTPARGGVGAGPPRPRRVRRRRHRPAPRGRLGPHVALVRAARAHAAARGGDADAAPGGPGHQGGVRPGGRPR